MTIIIKDVPGLTVRETIEALTDITDPSDRPITTGHGGFVVDEDVAERFLSAYLIAAGRRPAPVAVAGTTSKPTGPEPDVPAPEPVPEPDPDPAPERPTTRRGGTRKRGGTQ